ncbi:hypothetical protein PV326_009011 [Microctonus aethiopoides]|nr:hypothetical protein PV326_009011 [Microctonus aethiopoides]
MAYLSRCQIVRKIPELSSNILEFMGSGSVSTSRNSFMATGIRGYALIPALAKNIPRFSLQRIEQYSKKFSGSLIVSANQIRASSTTGDHVRLWQIERIVSAAFIVLLPACVLLNNAVVDVAFSILTVMHAHWGLEAIILDYARPAVVGPILPKVLFASLYLLSIATLAGLMALVYNGPGVGGSIRKMWSIGK